VKRKGGKRTVNTQGHKIPITLFLAVLAVVHFNETLISNEEFLGIRVISRLKEKEEKSKPAKYLFLLWLVVL